jgi:hypothetical protein
MCFECIQRRKARVNREVFARAKRSRDHIRQTAEFVSPRAFGDLGQQAPEFFVSAGARLDAQDNADAVLIGGARMRLVF